MSASAPQSASKRLCLWTGMFLALYLFLEGGALLTLTLLAQMKNIRFEPKNFHLSQKEQKILSKLYSQSQMLRWQFDKNLGWLPRPGAMDFNGQGLRTVHKETYAQLPSAKIRLSGFGDSYTFGEAVKASEVWGNQLTIKIS